MPGLPPRKPQAVLCEGRVTRCSGMLITPRKTSWDTHSLIRISNIKHEHEEGSNTPQWESKVGILCQLPGNKTKLLTMYSLGTANKGQVEG